MNEPLMINVGDLLALMFWLSFPAIALWRWYTNASRPVRRKKK